MSKQETIMIIDYGSGNIASAQKALAHVVKEEGLKADVVVSDRAEDVLKASRIVLPGQGAFGDCMDNLQNTDGMIEALEEAVLKKGTAFLGICVGMQLLATRGLENGSHAGLNWIPGQVVSLSSKLPNTELKIPHMGWNEVFHATYEGASSVQDNRHFVLRSTESSDDGAIHYYFVHSYMFECEYNHHILGMTHYGVDFASIVGKDNIFGVQFHPEKSQQAGLTLLRNFVQWTP